MEIIMTVDGDYCAECPAASKFAVISRNDWADIKPYCAAHAAHYQTDEMLLFWVTLPIASAFDRQLQMIVADALR